MECGSPSPSSPSSSHQPHHSNSSSSWQPPPPPISAPKPHSPSLTLVTAFFDIGPFTKGSGHRSPSQYLDWARVWSRVASPLLIYVDNKETYDLVGNLRDELHHLTRVVLRSRADTWAFPALLDDVARVFSRDGYPQHQPNTVNPAYATVTHAKVGCMRQAISNNYFNTEYFAWVDFGFFRNIPPSGGAFTMTIPANLSEDSVAFSEVAPPNFSLSPWKVIVNNQNWLAAGYFVARKEVMENFVAFYMNFTEKMVKHDLMGVEQQVLYSMFTDSIRPYHQLKVQTYVAPARASRQTSWFYLGYYSTRGLYHTPCPPFLVKEYSAKILQ